ncbi:phosphohistidine phosphatase SixA [Niabella terrae]
MKTLIIIRHAKAVQSFGPDSQRKLTPQGHKNALKMAEHLKAAGYQINKIFSSPALRTKETTAIFAEVLDIGEKDIKYFDNLYLGDTLQITEAVNWLQENVPVLAIVGHNPGVTNFTNDVTGSTIEALPTCGVAIIQAETENWQDFEEAQKKLVEVISPKELD